MWLVTHTGEVYNHLVHIYPVQQGKGLKDAISNIPYIFLSLYFLVYVPCFAEQC